MRSQSKNKREKIAQAAITTFKMVNADTKQFFEAPSQQSAEFHLEKGMIAVIFYIEPEYDGKGWREGSISIAVVKEDLLLIADAIDYLKQEAGEKKIHMISVEDDQAMLHKAKEFIISNSNQFEKFNPYPSQLKTDPISIVNAKEIVKLRFKGNLLKIENHLSPMHFENNKKFSLKNLCAFFNKTNLPTNRKSKPATKGPHN